MDSIDLAEVLRAMKENAQLYRNIECRYRQEPEFLMPDNFKGATLTVRRETRVVLQGDLYYAWETVTMREPDGKTVDMQSEYGYDGEITRANDHNTIGNIAHERIPVGPWITPLQMAYPALFKIDLGDYIACTDEARASFPGVEWESRLGGREIVSDLACWKIICTARRKDLSVPSVRLVFWIAPERNYLAVRSEQYLITLNDVLPHVVSEADDWRELAPGIWAPYRGTTTHYSQQDLQQGIARQQSRSSVIVTYARLDPQYGIDLFRNIAMPKDAPIYTVKGGEIVESKIPIGLPTTEIVPQLGRRALLGSWLWTILIGTGLLVSGLGIWVWRKLHWRRCSEPSKK